MSFQFMGAFRQREGHKDGLSKYLRMLRATYGGILAGTVWLMFQSTGKVGYMGSPLEEALVGVLLFLAPESARCLIRPCSQWHAFSPTVSQHLSDSF